MTNLIENILNKKFDEAKELFESRINDIATVKLHEAKKHTSAKMSVEGTAFKGEEGSNAVKLRRGVLEEEDIEEAIDPEEKTQVSVEKGTPKPGPGSTHYKNMKEQIVNRDTKSSSPAYKSAQTRYTNRVITGKNTDGAIASSLARDDMTPQERMKSNKTQQINTQLRTPAPRASGYTDARTNKPYVPPRTEQMPLRGPTTQGSSQVNTAGKSDRVVRPSPISTAGNTTTVKKVTYEETEEQLDEARVKIVKARVRGGKIQRRKKVSNVPGMTMRGGQLKRMSPAERRRRKLGAKRGKIKRRSKMRMSMMKRKRSLRKRASIGL